MGLSKMNIVFATAIQLAQMIRDKKVSSVEVLNAYLKQIKKHNDKINAVATLNAEKARQNAKQADEALSRGENWGALHGVPLTLPTDKSGGFLVHRQNLLKQACTSLNRGIVSPG